MISDFKAGAKICQSVLLRVQRVGTSSNGAPFARGLAEDNSGKIPFITFEAGIVEKMREMDGPSPVMVSGSVDINKFSGEMALQLVIKKLSDIVPEDDITFRRMISATCCRKAILTTKPIKINLTAL